MSKENLDEYGVVRTDRDLLPLPERAGAVIRNGVFKLVNDTLQEAFPGQFGSIIPPLRPNDVHVVKEKDYLTFMRKHLKEGTHSYLRKQLSEVLNDFHGSTFDNLLTQEVNVGFSHLAGYPGDPILFPASQIQTISPQGLQADIRRGVNDLIIARHLLHENLHRAQVYRETKVTSPDDPLFSLAFFTTLMQENEIKDEKEKTVIHDMNERLRTYALDHDPVVTIDGVKVEAWCRDERDGKSRVIVQSGYDLNEALTEHFAIIALPHFYRLGEQRYDTRLVQILKENLFSSPGGSQRFLDLYPVIPKYLNRLGISPETALETFLAGNLPAIHAEVLSSRFYFS